MHQSWLYWAMGVTAIVIIGLVTKRYRMKDRQSIRDYYGDTPAPAYRSEDDETIDTIHRWAEGARRDSREYDTRTLAELASACPHCNVDHPGKCLLEEMDRRALDDSDVLTGTIVAVEDIPEAEITSGFLTPGPLLDELLHHWHEDSAGNWTAPMLLVDSLDKDDWLRRLLEEPVAIAA